MWASKVVSTTCSLSRKYGTRTPGRYLVSDVDDDRVELPEEIYEILLHVVDVMLRGPSVTVSPTSRALTTQQAADLQGISRLTLIKALEQGQRPTPTQARTAGSV